MSRGPTAPALPDFEALGLPDGLWPALTEPFPEAPPPEEAYARLCHRPAPFWLDSARDISAQGRYSFIGCDPLFTFRCQGDVLQLSGGGGEQCWAGDPFEALGALLARIRLRPPPGAPPFVGGAVGYLGYDLRTYIERLPAAAVDDLGVPVALFGFYGAVLAYDHSQGRTFLCSGAPWQAQAHALRDHLKGSAPPLPEASMPLDGPLRSSFSHGEYLAAVRRVRDYIAAGDIYQVNLSQRFSAPLAPAFRTPAGRLALYRRLQERTPAPYAALLDFGDVALLSASPERFLRITGRDAETRPIKGTRRRGATSEQDATLADELRQSPKDRAELLMIVDLERNDLGRVCEYGSVQVTDLFRLEAHPTVFHLVATVRGRLRSDVGHLECVRACFPGGSITGAPKIRAMEIIDKLEPTRRGPYTGAVGYFGWNGQTDLNIAIRTMTLTGTDVHFHVGGGIVADSDPEAEYQETLDKGRALARALGASEAVWDVEGEGQRGIICGDLSGSSS